MLKINYAIMTVRGEPEYIHDTLASMDLDQPVKLVVGSPDSSYLDRYRGNKLITIVEADPVQWQAFKDKGIRQRVSWNYWRCLISQDDGAGGIAIFEDDVVFAKRWKPYLEHVVTGLTHKIGNDFILALYCAYPQIKVAYERGANVVPYPGRFFGTQGMYFTNRTRQACAEYLRINAVENFSKPFDIVVGQFAKQKGTKLMAIVPCIVQHVGAVTTGLADFAHGAPGFVKEIVPRPRLQS